MELKELSKGRDNNLDIIRFIAASMVIFSHAYPIGLGGMASDFFRSLRMIKCHRAVLR